MAKDKKNKTDPETPEEDNTPESTPETQANTAHQEEMPEGFLTSIPQQLVAQCTELNAVLAEHKTVTLLLKQNANGVTVVEVHKA